MKVRDTAGREMLVDLVIPNGTGGWVRASTFELEGRSDIFARVPYGDYAVRICSHIGVDLLVFQNGQTKVNTSFDARTQIISVGDSGTALNFSAPVVHHANQVIAGSDDQSGTASGANQIEADIENGAAGSRPIIPSGPGLVLVVVRYSRQNSPSGEPPQEEFAISYQMLEPETFYEHLAQNLKLLKTPPALPNPRDEFSMEPAASEPSFFCGVTGYTH